MQEWNVTADPTEVEQAELVRDGEAHFNQQLVRLTDSLIRTPDLQMIGLTGPTCSGKTTAANMITEALASEGKRVHVISIDDFYFDKRYLEELTRKKGMRTLDYDSEDTIDVELLRSCVESLRQWEPTCLPRFNFITGDREAGERIDPDPADVFLFEGIQVLYPAVREILAGEGYLSVLIAPQTALRVGEELFTPNELRLLRRLVRDVQFRGTEAAFTLYLWESVRANEERSIFPYLSFCDLSVDSTMPYELGMLKPFLERDLNSIPKSDRNWETGQRILRRLASIKPISHRLLPQKSLYKEFIAL
ncbi:MAG: hypothetical protein E7620_04230 [Ruminococcaceae bacterium]|nr:hypothetical protein [Oscillospiraceae bacterium]